MKEFYIACGDMNNNVEEDAYFIKNMRCFKWDMKSTVIQKFEVSKLLLLMVDSLTLVFDLVILLKFN